jgi:hypothetical protein
MDDAALVRVCERGRHVAQNAIDVPERAWPMLVEQVAQRATRHELHNERETTVADATHGIQRDDVGMLELRDRPCLASKASDRLVVIGVLGPDDLDRHQSAELTVARPVHDSGRTAAQLAEYFVFSLEICCREVRFNIAKHQPTRLVTR